MINREVVVVAAKRTPIGSFLGSLAKVPAVQLGAIAARATIESIQFDRREVTECIMGNALPMGLG